jgi:hypothetical protein
MNYPVTDCPDVYSIWSYDDNNVWAVSTSGLGGSSSKAKLHYFNGSTWVLQLDMPIGYWGRVAPCNIHGISPTDIWMVGWRPLYANDSRHWHFDGVTWNQVLTTPASQLTAVFMNSSTDVMFSGSRDAAYHTPSYTGPIIFSPVTGSNETCGIGRLSNGNYVVQIVGGVGVYVGNVSGFSRTLGPLAAGYTGTMAYQQLGVYDNEIYAFWDNGKYHYYNGTVWSELEAYNAITKPNGVVTPYSAIAQNKSYVWCCGASGKVCRYNPSNDSYAPYNNPLGFGNSLFTIWGSPDPVPVASTSTISNVFVVSKDVIKIEFSSSLSASKDFWKTSSYSISDVNGSTAVEVKEVRPVYSKTTTHIYLKTNGLKWGNTYSVVIAADKIYDINGNALPTDSSTFFMERTKTDSIISSLSNMYDVKVGTNLRSLIEAITIEDEKIGGSF